MEYYIYKKICHKIKISLNEPIWYIISSIYKYYSLKVAPFCSKTSFPALISVIKQIPSNKNVRNARILTPDTVKKLYAKPNALAVAGKRLEYVVTWILNH